MWLKRRICTTDFGLGALHEIVARHQLAVDGGGQGFEPACSTAAIMSPIAALMPQ
jgi:hypothetical protein